jgi:arginine decarboxylase
VFRYETNPNNGGEEIMSAPGKVQTPQVDQFFTVTEARFDRWRALLQAARTWENSANQEQSKRRGLQEAVAKSFQELLQWEDFFAYPGHSLLRALQERIDSGDTAGTARLIQSISAALLTHSYRTNLSDWESDEQSSINFAERIAGAGEEYRTH